MLEYWYKERRSLVDFRRGPLGPIFDGFAAWLKERGYSHDTGRAILGKCCLFNSYLIDQGVTKCKNITPAHREAFLDCHLADFRTTSGLTNQRAALKGQLNRLCQYLVENKIIKPVPPKPIPAQYRWILVPYLRYLREEREFIEATVQRSCNAAKLFLDSLGEKVTRTHMKALQAEAIDAHVQRYLKESPENLRRLIGALRGFLHYLATQNVIAADLSRLFPSIPSYRLAALPKGLAEAELQRILDVIQKDSAEGARDYAILSLMMVYGIRGKSAAEMQLEDLNWSCSTVRIRACKGGKEVVLPLLDAVGKAILRYLHFRPKTEFREVFLSAHAPFLPIKIMTVSAMVRRHMSKAGVLIPRGGSRTLRHSWAIRALAHDSPIKTIADVLGHRCLNTTFIYAKADIKTLQQVAMPWPKEE